MQISAEKSTLRRARVTGHFGEWIQGKLHPEGPIVLVSVPCTNVWVELTLTAADRFVYDVPIPSLPDERAQALLRILGQRRSGRLTARTNMIAGAGLGASTASLLALARVAGHNFSNGALSQALLKIEGASDPLSHNGFDGLLWASRQAQVIDRFAPPPAFSVLGGLWGKSIVTNPDDENFAQIDDLIHVWRIATAQQNRKNVAAIATESALRTAALRDPAPEPLAEIARSLGALGFVRAHTGSARGLLFAPGQAPDKGLHLMAEAGYRCVTHFQTRGRP